MKEKRCRTPVRCATPSKISVAIITPAAEEDVWHINTSTVITVPCGCCVSVSAEYVDATEDDATVTPTPSIFVRRNASITVNRIA